jgi:DNA repair protein RecO (recombination protein O)
MLEKTRGIILNQIKYTDSGIVARMYTRKFGRQSFIIKGMRNRKAGKHTILFQPLFILDLEINFRQTRELQSLREFSVVFSPYDIHSDIRKSSIAIFLGEVLNAVIREESPNEELFDYIQSSIIYFENCSDGYANFHISFLVGLSSYLGFEPARREGEYDRFFDLKEGAFVNIPPVHGHYADEHVTVVLSYFFAASFDTAGTIPMTGSLRNEVLKTLIKYYSLHLPGMAAIKSLDVLKDVFS